MASNLSGLFGGMTKSPEQYRQESIQGMRVSPAQMGQQSLNQQLISQMSNVGANIGSLAGGMMGGQTQQQAKDAQVKEVIQSVSNIASPLGQAQAAYQLFTDKGMTEEAQKTMGTIQALQDDADKKEMSDAQLAAVKAKTLSDLNTDNTKGTGPERMIMFVGSIRRRLAKGEKVPEDQIAQAEDFRTFLAQNKVYADKEGNVVNVTTSQLSPIRPPNSKGAATQGSQSGQSTPPTGNTTTSNGMTVATNTNTPQALKAQKQVADKRRTLKASFTDGLGLLNEIIDNSDWTTRGLGGDLASLNPYSESSSQRRTQQTIIAKLVTETLADLKSQSATGATGFGALNEAELQIIKDQITNLNPSDPNYDKRLLALRDRWERAIALIDQEAGSNNREAGSNNRESASNNRESASKPQDLSQFDTPN